MAIISGYTSLSTAVSAYLGRSDLSSYVPNFVQNWEERFYRDSKNWARWMESPFSVTISGNVAALPSNYLSAISLYVNGVQYGPLKRINLDQLYARYPRDVETSVPMYYARNGSNLEFGPEGADGYIIEGTYYAKPTAMRIYASDAAAHWIIVNAPDLALYGSLLEASPFIINDERIMVWQSFYNAAVEAYRSQNLEESYSSPFMVAG